MTAPGPSSPTPPMLRVRTPDGHTFRFSQPFHIGRGDDCEVRIDDVHVSRKHVAVSISGGQWEIRDLQSSNGVFLNGDRVVIATIDRAVALRLGGEDGPSLTLEAERPGGVVERELQPTLPPHAASGDAKLPVDYAERYFGAGAEEEELGPRTIMIRKAFQEVQKNRSAGTA